MTLKDKDDNRWKVIKYLLGLVTAVTIAMIGLLLLDKEVSELGTLVASIFGFASTVFTFNFFTAPKSKGADDVVD